MSGLFFKPIAFFAQERERERERERELGGASGADKYSLPCHGL